MYSWPKLHSLTMKNEKRTVRIITCTTHWSRLWWANQITYVILQLNTWIFGNEQACSPAEIPNWSLILMAGCTVVWWLELSPHSKRSLSVWSLHVLPVYAWVLSGYSGFLPLPQKHECQVKWWLKIDPWREWERGWLYVSLVSVWPWCTGDLDVSCLLPNDSWDRLQPPCHPELD